MKIDFDKTEVLVHVVDGDNHIMNSNITISINPNSNDLDILIYNPNTMWYKLLSLVSDLISVIHPVPLNSRIFSDKTIYLDYICQKFNGGGSSYIGHIISDKIEMFVDAYDDFDDNYFKIFQHHDCSSIPTISGVTELSEIKGIQSSKVPTIVIDWYSQTVDMTNLNMFTRLGTSTDQCNPEIKGMYTSSYDWLYMSFCEFCKAVETLPKTYTNKNTVMIFRNNTIAYMNDYPGYTSEEIKQDFQEVTQEMVSYVNTKNGE